MFVLISVLLETAAFIRKKLFWDNRYYDIKSVFVPILFFFKFFLNFILFLNFTILYWFCHISKWICHRYTCVPHPEPSSLLPPHTIPLGRPSAPAPSIQYRASILKCSFTHCSQNDFLKKYYHIKILQCYGYPFIQQVFIDCLNVPNIC